MWLSSTHFGRSLHQPLASASFRAEYSGCSLIRARIFSLLFSFFSPPTVVFSYFPVRVAGRVGLHIAASAAGGPFSTAMTIVLHRFASLALKSRIDARKRVLTEKSLHRFPSLALKSRIDARKRVKTGKSLHRFASLALKSRIAARRRA